MTATAQPAWWHAAILLLALVGFAGLALAMERHQEELFGKALSIATTRYLRAAGWLLLALCLWLAVACMGWSLGLVAYSGHTSAAAALVFAGLLVANRVQESGRQRAKAAKAAKAPPQISRWHALATHFSSLLRNKE